MSSIDLLLSSDLPATAALLRVGTVEFSSSVPTAAMIFNPRTARAKILLNQEFVSQKAEKPLRLSALILHELFHHLLHHYVLYPSDSISNIAQDSLINALICRLAPSFQQLFNDCYSKNEFPSNFLRPGGNLRRIEHEEIREIVSSSYKVLYRKANRAMLANYKNGSANDMETLTVDDLQNMLGKVRKLQEAHQKKNNANGDPTMKGLEGLQESWWGEDDKNKVFLLGQHPKHGDKDDGGTAEYESDPFDPTEMEQEQVEEFAEMLDSINNDLSSSPNAAGLYKKAFKINQEDAPDALLEAMAASLREDVMMSKEIIEEVIGPRPATQSVVPKHIGRKEILLLASDIYPVFYPAFAPEEKPSADVIIYIDVSGSMGDQAEFLLMLMTGFKNQIGTEFYQFSTVIEPVNFLDFLTNFEKTGQVVVQTTGGTAFDPIFKHTEEKGYKKILLITDGCAGLSTQYERFAEDIETYTVFTQDHSPEPLVSVSKRTWVMPQIKKVKVTKE